MAKRLWELFYTFAKVGVMTFGGGYAMLPILQREVVENKGWATEEELANWFAIGQCTPGVIAVNTATFAGRKVLGNIGGVVATLGVVFPSLIIISQHGWAHIFQNEHEHLTKAGYRVVLMVSGSWKYAVAYDPHSKTAIMILRQENFRNRLVKLQNGEMHYVFSGLPANQDLNEMVPQYEQMSLFGQDKAVQQKAEKPFDELEQAVDGEVLRFGILTYRLDLAQLIRSCTLEILNANGCIVDEMNLDSAIPMNWKEAVPEDEITKFKEETGNEYGVQIDSIPEFKPRKKFVRKDG